MLKEDRSLATALAARKGSSGFDYLRLVLALGVLAFHCATATEGYAGDHAIWTAWWRGINALVLPMFFALSGFLLAGSISRLTPKAFVLGRIARLWPALAVVVAFTAFIIGPLVTQLSGADYWASAQLWRYVALNLVGWTYQWLPGVFADNPSPGVANLPLWTLKYQILGYGALIAAVAFGVMRRPMLMLGVVIGLHLLIVVSDVLRKDEMGSLVEVPPRLLVLTFLCGVALYAWRDRVGLSWLRLATAAIASVLLLSHPLGCYLAPLPVAYMTVALGLLNPPRTWLVKGRDLSYGIYVYGFPLQQTLMLIWPTLSAGAMLAISTPLVVAVAALSWHWIEKPGLRLRFVSATRPTAAAAPA